MKLSGFKADYQWFSAKASDVARQLAFAGIGVVWVFRVDGPAGGRVPPGLLLPITFLSAALAFDLLQYVFGTIIWGSFHRYHEKKLTKSGADPDILAPRYFTYPQLVAFVLKLLSVAAGYYLLLQFLIAEGPLGMNRPPS
jgi:hypothetical protein